MSAPESAAASASACALSRAVIGELENLIRRLAAETAHRRPARLRVPLHSLIEHAAEVAGVLDARQSLASGSAPAAPAGDAWQFGEGARRIRELCVAIVHVDRRTKRGSGRAVDAHPARYLIRLAMDDSCPDPRLLRRRYLDLRGRLVAELMEQLCRAGALQPRGGSGSGRGGPSAASQ